MSDFEKATEELKSISEQGMSEVSKLATKQIELQNVVTNLESQLKQAKKDLKVIQEDLLPAALSEHNVTSINIEGNEIKVENFYSASIPKDRQEQAFSWLLDNGHGDLIKNVVSANFVRGQEGKAQDFVEELAGRGLSVSTKKWVEPMSLKAFVKDLITKGESIPMDDFGVFVGTKAKITKK